MPINKKTSLILAIMLFIILIIPYFENIMVAPVISFFGKQRSFLKLYLPILLLGMILGGLILITVQGYIQDMKQKKPEKFDLT